MVMIRFGGQQANTATFTFGGRFDADRALPSIETDSSSADDRADTPSTTNYNPSTSTDTRSQRCDSTRVDADPQLSGLKDLRLGSSEPPSTSSSQADSCTPSIDITPAASPDIVMPNVNERSNDLTARLSALGLRGSTRTPPRSRRENVESPSPRRRRSGSAVNKELYRVEDEALLTSAYSPKMQRAFGNAKTEAASLAKALSSSTLHLESGSTIEKLHRQALELSEFKLPVSRIVGLVGDSGVGKSSLINALLDAADLARAVSIIVIPASKKTLLIFQRAVVGPHVHVR